MHLDIKQAFLRLMYCLSIKSAFLSIRKSVYHCSIWVPWLRRLKVRILILLLVVYFQTVMVISECSVLVTVKQDQNTLFSEHIS
jgi:hypothetical protein